VGFSFMMIFIIKYLSKMAKARKEGKPKRNRRNLAKKLSIIQKNAELIAKYCKEL
jgi:hypothetical protein